jgi:hypothetical protein
MEINAEVKRYIEKFLNKEEVKEALKQDDWDKVINLYSSDTPTIYYIGPFIDLLVKSGINFTSYIKNVPNYAFYMSALLKVAELRECERIGSRAFRKSNIETIYLSKDHLKDLDVGIFSECNMTIINIKWDGYYSEWVKIRRNSNCFYNYMGTVVISCIDGDYKENKNFD